MDSARKWETMEDGRKKRPAERTSDCVAEYHLQMPRQWEGMSKMGRRAVENQLSFASFLKDPSKMIIGSEASDHEAMKQEIMRKHKQSSQYVVDLLIYAHDREAKEKQTVEKARLREIVEAKRAEDREARIAAAEPRKYIDRDGSAVPFGKTSVQRWMRTHQPRDYEKFSSLLKIAQEAERTERYRRCIDKIDARQEKRIAEIAEKEVKQEKFHQEEFELYQEDQKLQAIRSRKKGEYVRESVQKDRAARYSSTVKRLVENEKMTLRTRDRIAQERHQRKEEKIAELEERERRVRIQGEKMEKHLDEVSKKTLAKSYRKVNRATRRHGRHIEDVSLTTEQSIVASQNKHYEKLEEHEQMLAVKRESEVKKQSERDQKHREYVEDTSAKRAQVKAFSQISWKRKIESVQNTLQRQQDKREAQLQAVDARVRLAARLKEQCDLKKSEVAVRLQFPLRPQDSQPGDAHSVVADSQGGEETEGTEGGTSLPAITLSNSGTQKKRRLVKLNLDPAAPEDTGQGRYARLAPSPVTNPDVVPSIEGQPHNLPPLNVSRTGDKAEKSNALEASKTTNKYNFNPDAHWDPTPKTVTGKPINASSNEQKVQDAVLRKQEQMQLLMSRAKTKDDGRKQRVMDANATFNRTREASWEKIKEKDANPRLKPPVAVLTPRPPSMRLENNANTPQLPYSAREREPRSYSPAGRKDQDESRFRTQRAQAAKQTEYAQRREETREMLSDKKFEDHRLQAEKEERILQRKMDKLTSMSQRRLYARKERETACESAKQIIDQELDSKRKQVQEVRLVQAEEHECRRRMMNQTKSFHKAKKVERPIDRYELREAEVDAKAHAEKARFQPSNTL